MILLFRHLYAHRHQAGSVDLCFPIILPTACSHLFPFSSLKDSVSSSNSTSSNLIYFSVFAEWFKGTQQGEFFSDYACILKLPRSPKGKDTDCCEPLTTPLPLSCFRKTQKCKGCLLNQGNLRSLSNHLLRSSFNIHVWGGIS